MLSELQEIIYSNYNILSLKFMPRGYKIGVYETKI